MAEEVDHLDLNFCKQCHTNKTKLISSCRSLVGCASCASEHCPLVALGSQGSQGKP